MTGTGKKLGKIAYFQKDINLSEKKIVFTSGSGGVFKSGIPVGEIISDQKVKFFSDLSQLTFVKLVSFDKVEN